MRAFVWIMFCFYVLAGIARFIFVAFGDHPRRVTYSRAEDSFGLLFSITFAVWAAWVLWA